MFITYHFLYISLLYVYVMTIFVEFFRHLVSNTKIVETKDNFEYFQVFLKVLFRIFTEEQQLFLIKLMLIFIRSESNLFSSLQLLSFLCNIFSHASEAASSSINHVLNANTRVFYNTDPRYFVETHHG